MYNRITYDLAFGYLGIMDDMILVQVIGYLVILNLFLHFKKKKIISRPGASSGIFLGAVTLPAVMISRLIQLSRAFSLHEVGIKGI